MTEYQYFSFQRCREAFARGQSDSRPKEIDGCYFRLRGVTKKQWTLLSFDSPQKAYELLRQFKSNGEKVKAMNFTCPKPTDLPTKRADTEWIVEDYDSMLARSGATAQGLRRATKGGKAVEVPYQRAFDIFQEWVQWAGGRHYMVFKGHYLQWLKMYYDNPANTHLVGIETDGEIEGIFGWESLNGVHQVTLAKHTPRLRGKVMWAVGLKQIGVGRILCGSTADDLKKQLGMTPIDSWTFDISQIPSDLPRKEEGLLHSYRRRL